MITHKIIIVFIFVTSFSSSVRSDSGDIQRKRRRVILFVHFFCCCRNVARGEDEYGISWWQVHPRFLLSSWESALTWSHLRFKASKRRSVFVIQMQKEANGHGLTMAKAPGRMFIHSLSFSLSLSRGGTSKGGPLSSHVCFCALHERR